MLISHIHEYVVSVYMYRKTSSVEISLLIEISFEFSPLIIYLFFDGMYKMIEYFFFPFLP